MSDYQEAMEKLQLAVLRNEETASLERLRKAIVERETAEIAKEREELMRRAVESEYFDDELDVYGQN